MIVEHLQRHGKKWGGAGIGITAAFLMTWEGYEPVAKHERIDPPSVITYCFGRTNYDDPTIAIGERFSREQCQQFLEQDLPKYVAPLEKCIPGFDNMPPHRQAAIASAGYNLGSGRVCNSSIGKNLRAGNVQAACDSLLQFDRANGRVIRGLQLRRQAEREMCLRND